MCKPLVKSKEGRCVESGWVLTTMRVVNPSNLTRQREYLIDIRQMRGVDVAEFVVVELQNL